MKAPASVPALSKFKPAPWGACSEDPTRLLVLSRLSNADPSHVRLTRGPRIQNLGVRNQPAVRTRVRLTQPAAFVFAGILKESVRGWCPVGAVHRQHVHRVSFGGEAKTKWFLNQIDERRSVGVRFKHSFECVFH